MPKKDDIRYCCDCMDRVLPLYERIIPEDSRPRRAIEMARRFILGTASGKDLDRAREVALEAMWQAGLSAKLKYSGHRPVGAQASSVAAGAAHTTIGDVYFVTQYAAGAVAWNAVEDKFGAVGWDRGMPEKAQPVWFEAEAKERRWQDAHCAKFKRAT